MNSFFFSAVSFLSLPYLCLPPPAGECPFSRPESTTMPLPECQMFFTARVLQKVLTLGHLERCRAFLLPKVQRMDLREHLHCEKLILKQARKKGGARKRGRGQTERGRRRREC